MKKFLSFVTLFGFGSALAAGPTYNFNFYNGENAPAASESLPATQQVTVPAIIQPQTELPPAPVAVVPAVTVKEKFEKEKTWGINFGYIGYRADTDFGNDPIAGSKTGNSLIKMDGVAVGLKLPFSNSFSIVPTFFYTKATTSVGEVDYKGGVPGGRVELRGDKWLGKFFSLSGGLAGTWYKGSLKGSKQKTNYTCNSDYDNCEYYTSEYTSTENFSQKLEGYGADIFFGPNFEIGSFYVGPQVNVGFARNTLKDSKGQVHKSSGMLYGGDILIGFRF